MYSVTSSCTQKTCQDVVSVHEKEYGTLHACLSGNILHAPNPVFFLNNPYFIKIFSYRKKIWSTLDNDMVMNGTGAPRRFAPLRSLCIYALRVWKWGRISRMSYVVVQGNAMIPYQWNSVKNNSTSTGRLVRIMHKPISLQLVSEKPKNDATDKLIITAGHIQDFTTSVIWKCAETVSYTHLDVYKRQQKKFLGQITGEIRLRQ